MKKHQAYNDAYKDNIKLHCYYSSYKFRSNGSVNFIFLRYCYQEYGKKNQTGIFVLVSKTANESCFLLF